MGRLSIFRRSTASSQQQQQQQQASPSSSTKTKKKVFHSSNHTLDTEHTSADDSIRSVSSASITAAVSTSSSKEASTSSSSTAKKTKTKKQVRIAPTKANKVHFTYSRLDDEIVTNRDIWWDMDELDALLRSDFCHHLVTPQERQSQTFPPQVQNLGKVVERVYNNTTKKSGTTTDEAMWKNDLETALQATLDWRGLEDLMGLNAPNELRNKHVYAVLQQVGTSRNNNKNAAASPKNKSPKSGNFKKNNNNKRGGPFRSSKKAVTAPVKLTVSQPLATSRVAAQMAAARAAHDAKVVLAEA